MATLSELRERVAKLDLKHQSVVARLASEQEAHDEAVAVADSAKVAQAAAQNIAMALQQQAHQRISSVVTRCLAAVFDEPYEFKIQFEQKRGKTEAVLLFEREGLVIDPLTAAGGGVIDLAAFALRLSVLMLARPPVRRLIVADEPFKHLSKGYRQKARQLLVSLSEELGFQFIMVTHDPAFEMGTVVELG